MKKIIVSTLTLLITACVSIYQPVPQGYVGATAIIKDSYENYTFDKKSKTYELLAYVFPLLVSAENPYVTTNFTPITGPFVKADFFILLKVDDKFIEDSWSKTWDGQNRNVYLVTRKVLPKKQKFAIRSMVFYPTDSQALFGVWSTAFHEFIFTPKADEIYIVKGEIKKPFASVWLEDSSGSIVEGSYGENSN